MVVMEHNRVHTVSRLAARAGIMPGMRLSSVQMLVPDAIVYQRELHRENEQLAAAAMACLRFTPQVCIQESACIIMNVGASLRLFGGIRRLRRLIQNTVSQLGLQSQIGIAISAQAACLLARHRILRSSTQARRLPHFSPYALSSRRLAQRLDLLPISLLTSAQKWLDWLSGIGCATLGELRQLPRAGLQRRCGKELLHQLDLAYNATQEVFQWLELPKQFHARLELPDRFEHTELIFHFARALLVQLCGWLVQQQLAVNCLEFAFEHERGRQAVAPSLMRIQLGQASWREEHLSKLLKEHLAQLQLTAAAIAIRLEAVQVSPMHAPNADLFPEPGGNLEEQSKLMELLVARLGAENVLHPAPIADHRPEVANHWVPILQKVKNTAAAIPLPLCRPTWLLPQPQLLEVRQHRPHYQSPLKLMSPAERIEAGWWNGQLITRDYFIAENAQHLRCWIYRERIGAAQQANDDEVWYLHGFFG